MNECFNEQMNKCIYELMNKHNEWMNDWIKEHNEWMNEWMHEWMNGQKLNQSILYVHSSMNVDLIMCKHEQLLVLICAYI